MSCRSRSVASVLAGSAGSAIAAGAWAARRGTSREHRALTIGFAADVDDVLLPRPVRSSDHAVRSWRCATTRTQSRLPVSVVEQGQAPAPVAALAVEASSSPRAGEMVDE